MPTQRTRPHPAIVKRPRNRLREIRENLGLSRVELGRMIKCSAKHILTLERGTVGPSIGTLLALREALKCSLDELYPMSTIAVARAS